MHLDYLTSRQLIMSQRVDSLKSEVLSKVSIGIMERNHKKRKDISNDSVLYETKLQKSLCGGTSTPLENTQRPKKLDDKLFHILKESSEKLVEHVTLVNKKTNESSISLEKTLKGIHKSIDQRTKDSSKVTMTSSRNQRPKDINLQPEKEINSTTPSQKNNQKKRVVGMPPMSAKSRFIRHVGHA